MNSAEIIPIRNDDGPDTVPASQVDTLLQERQRVLAELARLGQVDGPVRDAEASIQAINRAVEALDAQERDQAQQWAANGAGAPPEPRNGERAGLLRRRLELQSDVDAARNRATAVAPRRVMLNGELRRIDHLLFAEKLRLALQEARRLDTQAHEIALEMRTPIGRVAALRFALIQHQSVVAGNAPAERLIGETIQSLAAFRMPEIGGDPAKLESFVSEWRRTFQ
jgi:hypothetical protein